MSESGDDQNRASEGSARPIVALGASAGGLEAFREFLRHTPADTGMAFVLVQSHTRHASTPADQLSADSPLPVHVAEDGLLLLPNRVYVIPSGRALGIARGRFRNLPGDPAMTATAFFCELALDQGRDAIGIVLSGVGSDGTAGLRAIREHGGLTLAQEPETARYGAMPRTAADNGLVDEVLRVDQMPARLVRHAAHSGSLERELAGGIEAALRPRLAELLEILRVRTGHDFSSYKPKTIGRRVLRRLQVNQLSSVDEYLELLAGDDARASELVRDLLVGVTQFFRDPEAFRTLARDVLTGLVRARPRDIRIWVPGCSTGEEAYTLAMLLSEEFDAAGSRPLTQIFATDLDDRALDRARLGVYSPGATAAIPPEWLDKYFHPSAAGFTVDARLREMCIFSQHDLIRDPPFSRLDLISCRNVLIYLQPELQTRVLELFHYALREGGRLLLGPSESATGCQHLFRAIDKRSKIFAKKPSLLRQLPALRAGEGRATPRRAVEQARRSVATLEQGLARELENVLLDRFMPPTMVVNDQGDVVFLAGRTGKWIEPPSGALTLSALSLVHRQLRSDLRVALHESIRTRATTLRERLPVETGQGTELVSLTVRPLEELGDAGLYAIVFREIDPHAAEELDSTHSETRQVVSRLESQLRSSREHLQTTIEELETSNEELKSANEELLSTNEELKSLNEEFETVNAELKRKVEELDALTGDLDNLLRSTQIPVLFLDGELKIRRFTPATSDVFHLIDTDLGRPITHLAARFPASFLPDDAREVLRTLGAKEREVQLEDARTYVLRITPYRTIDNVIDGVVVSFLEITSLKEAEEHRSRLAAIVESASEAVIGKSLDGTITSWNRAAERMYGYGAEEVVGKSISIIVPPERESELQNVLERLERGERVPRFETERVRIDGRRLVVSLTVSPVLDGRGRVIGASAIARDITEQKAAERSLQASEQRYRSLVAASSSVVFSADPTGAFVTDQSTWQAFTGQKREEALGWGWVLALHPDDRGPVQDAWRRALAERSTFQMRFRIWSAARRAHRHVLARAVPVLEVDGQAREWIGMLTDITAERDALEALRITADELRVLFENSAAGTIEADGSGRILRANAKFAEMTGWPADELVGKAFAELVHPEDRHDLARRHGTRLLDWSGELRMTHKLGREFHVQLGAATIGSSNGAGERVIAVLHDITERKTAEAELTRAKRAAEDASRAKDQFLAVLSHELRTPLMPALAAAHKLERTEALSGDGKAALRMIQRNIDLEARLIDDLLDLTRISRGRMELRPTVIDASTVMEQALEIVSIDVDAKSLRVETALEPGCHVRADSARLQQVFWNLLKNAIKFTPSEGTIRAVCRPDGAGRIVAEVSDTGIGIERQLLPHVFDAFEQGDQAREGLGLGLAISRALVRLHGGQITAESSGPGRGAAFRVVLPECTEAPAPTPRRGDTPVEVEPGALRVLLVEDHADSAELMRELLELSGHRVRRAASLAEAIDLAEESDAFDLLLSDLGLPDGSGLELVRRLREAGKVRHAIALSGYGMEDDIRRSLEAGFEEHLVKPISPRDLDATIRRVTR